MSSDFFISLLTIIGIDLILGGDNAIVVALACRNLPDQIKNKAMIAGITLAIVTRGALTLVAVQLLEIPFAMTIGGIVLLWIAFRLLTNNDQEHEINSDYSFLNAIKTIVIADLVMGFDNVIAVAGAANGNSLLVFLGLLISVPIIIWGSKLILFLMNKYEFIIYIGAGILVYTSAKMILHQESISQTIHHLGLSSLMFTFLLIIAILSCGWLYNQWKLGELSYIFRSKK